MIHYLFVFFIVVVSGQKTIHKCHPPYEIECDDGSCIDKLLWCDAEVHCLDESDEKYCRAEIPCKPDIHFECKSKRCVPISAVCDTYDDCQDFSDEMNCSASRWLEDDSLIVKDSLVVQNSTSQILNDAPFTHSSSVNDAIDKAVGYLMNMRDSDYGWGSFTPRAVVALSLASKVSPVAEKNKQLMLKQLNIQVLQDLMHENTTLSSLALYINALHATCQDPRNFQGIDLVARLRLETDKAIKSKSTIPLVFLTLCLSNATKRIDNSVLAELYNSNDFRMQIGSRALIVLAMSCIMERDDSGIFRNYLAHFFAKELTESIPIADIYTQALFLQASTAVGVYYPIEIGSKQLPDGSFGDMLSTYYAIPVLLKSSLLDLVCDGEIKRSNVESDLYRSVGNNEVTYSLWIASGKDQISHSIKVKFDRDEPFLDIMKTAASRDPLFRFQYEESDEGKKVYSIAGIPNDIESGTNWFLYRNINNTKVNTEQGLQLLDLSLDKISPDNNDHLIFWLRDLSRR